jgi:hypothetical protein
VGGESVATRFQIPAQLGVVEDLAVINNPQVPGLIRNWLLPACKVNDAEAGTAQADLFVQIDAKLVGAPMPDLSEHLP